MMYYLPEDIYETCTNEFFNVFRGDDATCDNFAWGIGPAVAGRFIICPENYFS